ncbi:hypothetical protein GW17_00018005, partial [Ensete ventricosum]
LFRRRRPAAAAGRPPPTPLILVLRDSRSCCGSPRLRLIVSRRRAPSEVGPAVNHPPHLRTYSLGSSFEYVVDEEVEAVVARIRRETEKDEKRTTVSEELASGPVPPGAEVAEAAEGGGRGWLREYVDRLASSSFSSFGLSGRWSHRYDNGRGGGMGRISWDLDGSERREAEEGGYYGFYRWLIGA